MLELFLIALSVLCLARSQFYTGNMEARLATSSANSTLGAGTFGVLEVRRNPASEWGYVCDDGFGLHEASVACKMLGFRWGEKAENDRKTFPLKVLLDQMKCHGYESRLSTCNHTGWGVHDCDPSEAVAIRCFSSQVRLVRSNSNESFGYLERRTEHVFTAICQDGFGGAATVAVCRQYGFVGGGRLLRHVQMKRKYADTRLRVLMTCPKDVRNLSTCETLMIPREECSAVAAVVCYRSQLPQHFVDGMALHLYNPSPPPPGGQFWGRIELRYHTVWMTVCAGAIGPEAVRVMCRQLNVQPRFRSGVRLGRDIDAPQNPDENLPILRRRIDCVGNESRLDGCPGWSSNDDDAAAAAGRDQQPCDHFSDLYILCYRRDDERPEVAVQPIAGRKSESVVALKFNGTWGRVCNFGWSDANAEVVCRQEGFFTGLATRGLPRSAVPEPIYLSYLRCLGYERGLLECPNSGWRHAIRLCDDRKMHATVACFGKVRLTQSRSARMGRVEMFHGNRSWAGLWDDVNWDDAAADVTCRQLGFARGRTLRGDAFGLGPRHQKLWSVRCRGDERSLLECHVNGSFRLDRLNYASVYCHDDELRDVTTVSVDSENLPATLNGTVGRVVLEWAGLKGRLCDDDSWDDADATVLCRQMNFAGGVATYFQGFGSGPFMSGPIHCNGTERHVDDCAAASAIDTCKTGAGILCYEHTAPTLELVDAAGRGTSSHSGAVRLSYDRQRVYVCEQSWSSTHSNIVCQQLGFFGGESFRERRVIPDDATLLVQDFRCDGASDNLFRCRSFVWHPAEKGCLRTSYVAGVRCFNTVQIQPLQNSFPVVGLVKLHDGYTWKTLCGSSFNESEARVVCGEYGYSHSRKLASSSFRSQYLRVIDKSFRCNGSESTLWKCRQTNISCEDPEGSVAYVACSHAPIVSDVEYTLRSKRFNFTGSIVATRFNVTGAVCPFYWNDRAASVACRQNGFPRGGAALLYTSSQDTSIDYSTVWLTRFNCSGNESSLSACRRDDLGRKCTSRRQVGVLCFRQQELTYKLNFVGRRVARVELALDGVTSFLCGARWGSQNARVVCRQFGYVDGTSVSLRLLNASAVGSLQAFVGHVDCLGTEETLLQCAGTGWFRQRCPPEQAAAVSCVETVRIESWSQYAQAGAVQINTDRLWGYVCNEGWDDRDATVTCRQLGYGHGIAVCCAAFGGRYLSQSQVKATHVNCTGEERSLEECPMLRQSFLRCASNYYASVLCADDLRAPLTARILAVPSVPSATQISGIVQINMAGVWGNVCYEEWTEREATVACRGSKLGERGFPYPSTDGNSSRFPFLVSGFRCTGGESSLLECEFDRIGDLRKCRDRSFVAGVVCSNGSTVEYRLVGPSPDRGRVEVSFNGRWGTICDQGWSNQDADVVCRSLDFLSGRTANRDTFPNGNGTVWLVDLQCTGSEETLTSCPHPGWEVSAWIRSRTSSALQQCLMHTKDAAVYCYREVRLSDGPAVNFGRIEFFVNNRWNMICDDGTFADRSAAVFCRSLGFQDGQAICCSALEPTAGFIGLSSGHNYVGNVRCDAAAESPLNCTYDAAATCLSGHYVTVYCAARTFAAADNELKISFRSTTSGAYSGQLVATHRGVTGRICPKNWDDEDAASACKTLGFEKGVSFQVSSANLTLPFVAGNFNCTGKSNITACPFDDMSRPLDCQIRDFEAGVLCYSKTIGLHFEGNNRNFGPILIERDGVVGGICKNGWSDTSSKVFCKSKGFVDGVRLLAYELAEPIAAVNRTWMSDVYCEGHERSLFRCNSRRWHRTSDFCHGAANHAHSFCYQKVRLWSSRTPRPTSGVVEVFKDEKWQLVCDDDWDHNEAGVVCRQLGFSGGMAACCSAFGYNQNRFYVASIECSGNETDVGECGWGGSRAAGECQYASAICLNETLKLEDYRLFLKPPNIQFSGKMLVEFAGLTGRVCADGWDDSAATVACRELGFTLGKSYSHFEEYSSYLLTDGPFWAGEIHCNGSERRLHECSGKFLGELRSCPLLHSAGVLCYNQHAIVYQMVGDESRRGRVEVSVNGQWGTVCDEGWDRRDARVFCRQNGFVDGEERFRSFFGDGSGPVWLTRIFCLGNESSLADCPHPGFGRLMTASCLQHRRDAGVVCFNEVRIVSPNEPQSSNASSGPVLLFREGRWHRVCSDDFDDVSARIVCRRQGFVDGRAVCCSAFGLRSDPLLTTHRLRCDGHERNVTECLRRQSCDSNSSASVICYTSLQPVNDSEISFHIDDDKKDIGRVIVEHLGVSGHVCDSGWTDVEASVLCRELGKGRNGVAYRRYRSEHPIWDEHLRLPFLASQFRCNGTERRLGDCAFRSRLELGVCTTGHEAGVICTGDVDHIAIRLQGAERENQGRVELKIYGVWGTICESGWTSLDVRVLCRSLNYTDGVVIRDNAYGRLSAPMWLNGVFCNGNESGLFDCPFAGWNGTDGIGDRGASKVGVTRSVRSLLEHFVSVFSQPSATGVSVAIGQVPLTVSATNWLTSSPSSLTMPCNAQRVASAFCFYDVSLSLGANATFGAIRKYDRSGKRWGLVCNVSDEDAPLICKALDATYVDGTVIPGSVFGESLTSQHPILYSSLACPRAAHDLDECKFVPLAAGAEAEGPRCRYSSLYCLYEQRNSENATWLSDHEHRGVQHGSVRVRINGFSGRVCNVGWNENAAGVVCRQLGWKGGVAMTYKHVAARDAMVLHSVECTGAETSIHECEFRMWGDDKLCWHSAPEAGVLCYNSSGVRYQLGDRVNTTKGAYGRVLVALDGDVGAVCSTSWDLPDARVFCRSMDFRDGDTHFSRIGRHGPSRIVLNGVECTGNENTLLECPTNIWNAPVTLATCHDHYHDAWVFCLNEEISIKAVKLQSSSGNSSGRIELQLSHDNSWGTVCDDGFDDADATVICRMLGFPFGKSVSNNRFGLGEGRILIDSLNCDGSEEHINNCSFHLGSHNCYHFEDVGVECSYVPMTTITTTSITTSTSSTVLSSDSDTVTPVATSTSSDNESSADPATTTTAATTTRDDSSKTSTRPPTSRGTTGSATSSENISLSTETTPSTTFVSANPSVGPLIPDTGRSKSTTMVAILVPMLVVLLIASAAIGFCALRRTSLSPSESNSSMGMSPLEASSNHNGLVLHDVDGGFRFDNKLYEVIDADRSAPLSSPRNAEALAANSEMELVNAENVVDPPTSHPDADRAEGDATRNVDRRKNLQRTPSIPAEVEKQMEVFLLNQEELDEKAGQGTTDSSQA